jgi:hypothetical protein
MIAPFALDGLINWLAFETCVERVLAPEFRRGDVILMTNLPNHKGRTARKTI